MFLQIASINRLPLVAEGQQPIARAQLAVTGGNDSQIQSLEISVMLDVTGSMAGQKLQDLKDSATDLINIVLMNGLNNLPVKVGIVPFSEDIRLPNTAAINNGSRHLQPAVNQVHHDRFRPVPNDDHSIISPIAW